MREPRILRIGGLFVAAVAVGLLAAWLARGEFKGHYAVPALGADRSAVAPPVSRPVGTSPAVPPKIAPAAAPRPTPSPPASAMEDRAPLDDASDDTEEADRMARAIDRAARKALDRGEPVRWHKAGEEGYVVVSEPRDDGGRLCRNVSATINRDDSPARSSAHLWCTTPDGDWAPAE